MRLVVFALVLACVSAAIIVPLEEREKPKDEQQMLLDFLQLGEGESDSNSRPPAALLDSNFFGKIQIGENKQEFKVIFDTGSSVLWVYSENCKTCQKSKHTFSPATSTTFHKRPIPFNIRYGTGESHGTTGIDQIYLSDLEIRDQPFGQCEEPDTVMRNFPFDGIVGLSRALISDKNAMPTIINTIRDEKLLTQKNLANSFSFYIGREENDPTYLIFGGSHDMLEKDSSVHWTSTLNKNIYWEIPLDDIFIHSKPNVEHTPNQRQLEQHQKLSIFDDQFAQMGADPELALLQLNEEIERIEEATLHSHSTHHSKSHRISAHKRSHHVIPTGDLLEEDVPKAKASTSDDEKAVSTEIHTDDETVQGPGMLLSQLRQSPGTSMNPCKQDDAHMCLISVDSGHSLMSGPPDVIREIKKRLSPPPGVDGCSEKVLETLPDLSFAIGGKLFTMTPVDYMIRLQGKCVPAFSERVTRNGHDWVLGEHFMRTFYTVFDHDNMRVGFAHLDNIKPHLKHIMRTGSIRGKEKPVAAEEEEN